MSTTAAYVPPDQKFYAGMYIGLAAIALLIAPFPICMALVHDVPHMEGRQGYAFFFWLPVVVTVLALALIGLWFAFRRRHLHLQALLLLLCLFDALVACAQVAIVVWDGL